MLFPALRQKMTEITGKQGDKRLKERHFQLLDLSVRQSRQMGVGMKKKSPKLIVHFAIVLALANIFSLTGCGKTEDTNAQTNQEVQLDISEIEQEITSAHTDMSVQTDVNAVQTQNDEQGVVTGGVMRVYSDTEKERMVKLQESYQNETAKPEKMIQEVGSSEDLTEGTLCYIVSTGEYYLPDRELTDEELLEIIDCNFRISLNTNRKTQADWDKIILKERAELEAKVQAAGGISEEKAVKIAQKALETDLGEKAKELKLCINETYSWGSDLCVADWSEIKEKDKGALAYCVVFNNADKVTEIDDLLNYNCTVNAVDGSILEAYTLQGWGDTTVRYEH